MTNDVKKNLWLFVYFADKEKGIIKPEHIFLLFLKISNLAFIKKSNWDLLQYVGVEKVEDGRKIQQIVCIPEPLVS